MIKFETNLPEFAGKINSSTGKIKKEFETAVKTTTAFGRRQIVMDMLKNKKTGQLGKSYKSIMISPLFGVIYSDSGHADPFEDGSKAHTIKPKNQNFPFLMFSNNESTRQKNTGQIKNAAVKNLFKAVGISKNKKLYSKVEGVDNILDIFEWVGVTLAREIKHPGYAGANTIKNKSLHTITSKLESEFLNLMKRSKL